MATVDPPARERLPLFPLPVVLFPGAPLPLHIFESRYRCMVSHCLAGEGRFGLLYHDPDERGPFTFEEPRVGCVARIRKARFLADGRSLLLVSGETRFRLMDGIESDTPYYEGLTVSYCDEIRPDPRSIRQRRGESLDLFLAVVQRLDQVPDEVPTFDLTRDLSFQLVPTVQIDPRWQQSFLESRDEVERLERLDTVFQAALETHDLSGGLA